MNRSKIIIAFLGCLCLFNSCRKETVIAPREVYSFAYTLPQGNHTYDDTIVSFYNKFHTTILYNFDNEADFRWTLTGIPLNFYAMPADSNYISAVLKYLIVDNLNIYSDTFLSKTLPYKFILSAGFKSLITNAAKPGGYDTAANPSSITVNTGQMQMGYNHLALGVVRSGFAAITTANPPVPSAFGTTTTFRGWLHTCYWQQAIEKGRINIPPAFITVTDFTLPNDTLRMNYMKYGLITQSVADVKTDFLSYVREMTSRREAEFVSSFLEPAATKDPLGKRRQKYNIIRKYYQQEYGFDLQAIGNAR